MEGLWWIDCFKGSGGVLSVWNLSTFPAKIKTAVDDFANDEVLSVWNLTLFSDVASLTAEWFEVSLPLLCSVRFNLIMWCRLLKR